jgi:hypothetical protein
MSTTMTLDTNERETIYQIARVFNGGGYFFVQIVMTWLIGEACGMSFGNASLIVCGIGLPSGGYAGPGQSPFRYGGAVHRAWCQRKQG